MTVNRAASIRARLKQRADTTKEDCQRHFNFPHSWQPKFPHPVGNRRCHGPGSDRP